MNTHNEPTYTLIADFGRRRVGCVLLQAAAGCDESLLRRFGFERRTWDTAPDHGQQRITGTESQWRRFAELCNADV